MVSCAARNRIGSDIHAGEPLSEYSATDGQFPSEDFMDLDEFISASGLNESISENYNGQRASSSDSIGSSTNEYVINPHTRDSVEGEGFAGSLDNDNESNSTDDSKIISDSESVYSEGGSQSRKRKADTNYVYKPAPIFKKSKRKFIPADSKDDKYWERRIKNNVAAKRSRDMRREKEIEIAELCKNLEDENSQLKEEILRLEAKAIELEHKVAVKCSKK